MISDVIRMRKTQDDELQFIVLVLEVRKKNKKKNTYLQGEGSAWSFVSQAPQALQAPQVPQALEALHKLQKLCGWGDEGECKWPVG